MAQFIKNNKNALIISIALSVIIYLIMTKIWPLTIAHPPGEKLQSIFYAWLTFIIIVIILFLVIFALIKLANFLIKKIKK